MFLDANNKKSRITLLYVIPIIILLSILSVAIYEYLALKKIDSQQIRRTVQAQADNLLSDVRLVQMTQVRSLGRMASRMSGAKIIDHIEWERDALNYIKDIDALFNLSWLDKEKNLIRSVNNLNQNVPYKIRPLNNRITPTAGSPYQEEDGYAVQLMLPILGLRGLVWVIKRVS